MENNFSDDLSSLFTYIKIKKIVYRNIWTVKDNLVYKPKLINVK